MNKINNCKSYIKAFAQILFLYFIPPLSEAFSNYTDRFLNVSDWIDEIIVSLVNLGCVFYLVYITQRILFRQTIVVPYAQMPEKQISIKIILYGIILMTLDFILYLSLSARITINSLSLAEFTYLFIRTVVAEGFCRSLILNITLISPVIFILRNLFSSKKSIVITSGIFTGCAVLFSLGDIGEYHWYDLLQSAIAIFFTISFSAAVTIKTNSFWIPVFFSTCCNILFGNGLIAIHSQNYYYKPLIDVAVELKSPFWKRIFYPDHLLTASLPLAITFLVLILILLRSSDCKNNLRNYEK